MALIPEPLPGAGGGGFGFDEPGLEGGGGFEELVQFVREATDHMLRMLDALVADAQSALGPNARSAAIGARTAIRDRRDQVVDAIQSGLYDSDLAAHGLADGTREWEFKYGVVKDGQAAFDEANREEGEPKKSKKFWKRGSWLLKKINIIFRSIAAAIPGAGGALTELKDGVESVVEIEAGETPD